MDRLGVLSGPIHSLHTGAAPEPGLSLTRHVTSTPPVRGRCPTDESAEKVGSGSRTGRSEKQGPLLETALANQN